MFYKNFILLAIAFLSACASDVSIVEQDETIVVVDSFIQSDRLGELDVLIALDTSGSMHDNYDDVADGMDILRSDIESLTLDYKFGYITMDPNRVSYVGPYDSSSTSIDMLMAPSLLPSTSLEEGFSATYTFLNSEEGLNFRRPEADFLLFLISDEDEQSSISADLFYEWMSNEFKDVDHDIVCVVHPDDGQGGHWSAEIGYKYIELASLYGKGVVDLQAEDWSVWLSDSSYLTSLVDYVVLSRNDAIIDSIVVYVDKEITYDWIYIENENTIKLNFVPDYGSLVEVGYNVPAN